MTTIFVEDFSSYVKRVSFRSYYPKQFLSAPTSCYGLKRTKKSYFEGDKTGVKFA